MIGSLQSHRKTQYNKKIHQIIENAIIISFAFATDLWFTDLSYKRKIYTIIELNTKYVF